MARKDLNQFAHKQDATEKAALQNTKKTKQKTMQPKTIQQGGKVMPTT